MTSDDARRTQLMMTSDDARRAKLIK